MKENDATHYKQQFVNRRTKRKLASYKTLAGCVGSLPKAAAKYWEQYTRLYRESWRRFCLRHNSSTNPMGNPFNPTEPNDPIMFEISITPILMSEWSGVEFSNPVEMKQKEK